MIIEKKEVLAVRINRRMFHLECVDLDFEEIRLENLLFRDSGEEEDSLIFCDKCRELIR